MDRIRKGFSQIPIPAAFVICGMAALLIALSLTKATMWFAQKNKSEIAGSYAEAVPVEQEQEQELYFSLENLDPIPSMELLPEEEAPAQVKPSDGKGNRVMYVLSPDAEVMLLEEDRKKYSFYEELGNIAAVFWYSVCLCLASLAFYLWKLKAPLRILNQAARKISDNDLNFQIDYKSQDELGRLCQAFETMRQELVQNNRKMWNSVEERKRLNAAFAHDLRTPLTVLQGHTDILLDTLNDKEEDHQEILSSLHAISNQITRMNSYMDTMSALRRLEDYDPCLKVVSSDTLEELLEETATSLFLNKKGASYGQGFKVESGQMAICHGSGCAQDIKTMISVEIHEAELWMDLEAFSQIYENLLSNAARYAREHIGIRLYREQDFVVLEVSDDGVGFTQKDLQNAFAPYYRGERGKPASSAHFGLGLYICNLLAGKLGGGMQLTNGENGGAKVIVKMVSFQKLHPRYAH